MDPDRVARVEVEHDPHRLLGIGVLRGHEPARSIGTDRDQRDVGRAMAFAHRAEDRAVAIAGVAREIDRARRGLQHEAAPQRHAAIARAARRPMVRRDDSDLRMARERDRVAPVADGDPRIRDMAAYDGVVAERRDDQRPVAIVEPPERRDVEVIIMVVRQQHRIDPRQILERDAGGGDAPRPREADRARPVGP